ncbi:hypothetical protein T265_14411 [Opisthorchis viverrini]|uniref:GPI ethanolamine phosphate transferase 1 n=1 Tax=Opisthorchis viverrini TaxID=6198 RepID=A0A074ZB02_OPIVI|nr:hypothetical protein T265_14411 [Opisthorchis viverrini]KER24481.1 hypothetical protein T265_14411 [Opisthorchis viverrini]
MLSVGYIQNGVGSFSKRKLLTRLLKMLRQPTTSFAILGAHQKYTHLQINLFHVTKGRHVSSCICRTPPYFKSTTKRHDFELVAHQSQLDIRITNCFVTHMEHGSVVYFAILKILLPLLCLGIISSAIQTHGNQESSAPYQALVTLTGCCTILSNLFIVQFFVWLRDAGSWLAIGTSIAHYGIAMGISLLTFVLLFVGLGMLRLESPMKLCMFSRQSFHTIDPL